MRGAIIQESSLETSQSMFKKHPKFFAVILLFLVSFLAYGQTMRMYVWEDDHAVMFKVQNPEGPAGQFGTGIYDRSSAYRGVLVPTIALSPLFGTNPTGYYFAGIVAYFLASIAVWFFVSTLTRNSRVGFAAGLIFAAGYVGAETLWRIFNSIHTSHAIAAICLSLGLYKKFIDTRRNLKFKRLVFYLSSLLVFVYAIETGFVRAHGIIFPVLFLELFWNFNLASLIRMTPFAYVYHQFYILGNKDNPDLPALINQLLVEQKFELLLVPLQNLQNIFLPSQYSLPILLFLLILIAVMIKTREKILLYAVLFMLTNYAAFFIHTPWQVFASTHRYFSIPLIGATLFMAQFLTHILPGRSRYFFAVSAVVILHLVLVNQENQAFIIKETIPTKRFFESFKREVSQLPQNGVLYFDVKDDAKSMGEFGNLFDVGSMPPTTALAWQYGIDRYDFKLAGTFPEILSFLKKQETNKDLVFTFYYDTDRGLINTTKTTREALFGQPEKVIINDSKNINFNFSSPLEVSIQVSTEIDHSTIKYSQGLDNLALYLGYLQSKEKYYKEASAQAVSEWKYQEVRNIIDSDIQTFWSGHRLHWHYEKSDSVSINLGERKSVGGVLMTYTSKDLVPTSYTYSCSLDGKIWNEVGKFNFTPAKESGIILDKVAPFTCQFVRLDIHSTKADDAPQIAELEIIENKYKDLDFAKAEEIEENPFLFINSSQDLQTLIDYLKKNGINGKVCFYTDKSDSPLCEELKITPNTLRNYSVLVPQHGTILKIMEIKLPPQIKQVIESISIRPLRYSELEKIGYILDFVEN